MASSAANTHVHPCYCFVLHSSRATVCMACWAGGADTMVHCNADFFPPHCDTGNTFLYRCWRSSAAGSFVFLLLTLFLAFPFVSRIGLAPVTTGTLLPSYLLTLEPGLTVDGFAFLELTALGMLFLFLVLLPELAHRALPWSNTSELTKSRITRWLATTFHALSVAYLSSCSISKGVR